MSAADPAVAVLVGNRSIGIGWRRRRASLAEIVFVFTNEDTGREVAVKRRIALGSAAADFNHDRGFAGSVGDLFEGGAGPKTDDAASRCSRRALRDLARSRLGVALGNGPIHLMAISVVVAVTPLKRMLVLAGVRVGLSQLP